MTKCLMRASTNETASFRHSINRLLLLSASSIHTFSSDVKQ